jgi:hypothetical protein
MMWMDLKDNLKERGLIHDYKGLDEKEPLRIRITIAHDVAFANEFKKRRVAELSDKAVKNAGEDDVQRLAKRTMQGHDKMGDMSTDIELSEMAQGMVTGRAGKAFNGTAMNLQDITSLLPDDNGKESGADDAPAAEDAAAAGGGTEGGDDAEAGKGTKKKWFDRDRQVNSVMKSSSSIVKAFVEKHEKVTQELEKALQDRACVHARVWQAYGM